MTEQTSLSLQYAVIALAVLLSLVAVLRSLFPNWVRGLRISLATRLLRAGRLRWLQRWGRRIAPAARGNGKDCGGCGGCDSAP
jgi:hypothetical protein